MNYKNMTDTAIYEALHSIGYDWLGTGVVIGILGGYTSVILVMLLGQSRVFYSMSRDGLLPKVFCEVHPKFRTPWRSNILFMVFVSLFSGFVPLSSLGDMTSIGTLLAFVIVCVGVMVMRRTQPESAAALSHAARSAGADSRHAGLLRHDGLARQDDLDPAGGLAGYRPCHLFRLQPPPQPSGHRTPRSTTLKFKITRVQSVHHLNRTARRRARRQRQSARRLRGRRQICLIVATDRISAFDCILPQGIPGKGRVLTQMSLFWFDFLRDVVPNHLITADVDDLPAPLRPFRDQLEGRSMLVQALPHGARRMRRARLRLRLRLERL